MSDFEFSVEICDKRKTFKIFIIQQLLFYLVLKITFMISNFLFAKINQIIDFSSKSSPLL